MKISSRSGRFKKKLVSGEQLLKEAPLIEAKMALFHDLHSQQKISDSELAAIYIVIVLSHRFPGCWLGAKRPSLNVHHSLNIPLSDFSFEPNIKKRLQGLLLGDVFNHFALRSTPETVNRAILNWSTATYPLELMFRIPSPAEVLAQQKKGRRCVSVLTNADRTKNFILGERDALSFTMHDLIHADHFYYHNECYQGQLALYGFLDKHQADFTQLMKNPEFMNEFEYLISDMNAYAIHSLKCLKAAIIHYGSVEEFDEWAQQFTVKEELKRLNSSKYIPEISDAIILKWLGGFATSAPI
jgi:hypothetical protein